MTQEGSIGSGAIATTDTDDATDEEIVSIVLVTGATTVGIGTRNSGGVGCLVSSLKVTPRLLETGVSITNAEEV